MSTVDVTSRVLRRLGQAFVVHRAQMVRAGFGMQPRPQPLVFTAQRGVVAAFQKLGMVGYVRQYTAGWKLTRAGEHVLVRGLVPPEPTRLGLEALEIVARYDVEHQTRAHDYKTWIPALLLAKRMTGDDLSEKDALLASLGQWYLDHVLGASMFYKLSKWGWLATPHKFQARTLVDGLVDLIWNRYDQEILDVRFTLGELLERGAVAKDTDPYLVEEIIAGYRLGDGDSQRGWALSPRDFEHFIRLGCKTGDEYLDNRQLVEAEDKRVVGVANMITAAQYDYDPEPFALLDHVLDIARAESWSASPPDDTKNTAWDIAKQSVEYFRHCVEERDGWRRFWDATSSESPQPRPEKDAQHYFFLVASVFCKHANLEITPEAETGRGPVDFKISSSFSDRVLVEVKLSNNAKLAHGYHTQLELYKKAERTTKAIYLIIDVGGMGKKLDEVHACRDAAIQRGDTVSETVVVNALPKKSASKA